MSSSVPQTINKASLLFFIALSHLDEVTQSKLCSFRACNLLHVCSFRGRSVLLFNLTSSTLWAVNSGIFQTFRQHVLLFLLFLLLRFLWSQKSWKWKLKRTDVEALGHALEFGEQRIRAVILVFMSFLWVLTSASGSSKIHRQWNFSARRDRLVLHDEPPALIVCFSSSRMSWISFFPTGSYLYFPPLSFSLWFICLLAFGSWTYVVPVCPPSAHHWVCPAARMHPYWFVCIHRFEAGGSWVNMRCSCVWPACPLLHLYLSFIFLLCPDQDERPAVTSSVFPRGWIHLPHVSLKGHTIYCKHSLVERYLEDGHRAQRVLLGIHSIRVNRNFIWDTMDQMCDTSELWMFTSKQMFTRLMGLFCLRTVAQVDFCRSSFD